MTPNPSHGVPLLNVIEVFMPFLVLSLLFDQVCVESIKNVVEPFQVQQQRLEINTQGLVCWGYHRKLFARMSRQ